MKAKRYCFWGIVIVGMMLGGCKKSQNYESNSDIHTLVTIGRLDAIESILSKQPELVNAKSEDGYMPLHLAAAISDNEEAVKLLIAKGADVNAKEDTFGATPLHMVFNILGNDKDIVKILVDHGANVNAKMDDGGVTPLHMAADNGLKDIIEFLISKGVDINGTDNIGGTALHHLAQEDQEDNVEMIEFLLSKGANINAKDYTTGGTPLHYAALNGYKNMVEFLIANGADAFSKALEEATPLMLAEGEGHNDVADLLRKHMEKVNNLLHSIKETGFDDKVVLIFTKTLKDIAPETNKMLGNAFKQDYSFDWFSLQMLALKMAELQFKALGMINDADKVKKAVESLETAWLESDTHEILYANFYNIELETVFDGIIQNMSEEEQQQLSYDTRPLKALAERLLKQDKEQAKLITK